MTTPEALLHVSCCAGHSHDPTGSFRDCLSFATMSSDGDNLLSGLSGSPGTIAISTCASHGAAQSPRAFGARQGRVLFASEAPMRCRYETIARKEGVLTEVSFASTLAVVETQKKNGEIKIDETVVSILAVTGLRDVATRPAQDPSPLVPADLDRTLEAIQAHYGHADPT
ncbi:hypothetical protein AAFN47_17270 [Hoeflea sp. CAU 1731]